MSDVCVMSRPFRLAEWASYIVPKAYGKAEPPRPDPGPAWRPEFSFLPLRGKWVYVFQRPADKREAVWYDEYEVDSLGNLYPVEMKLALGKERDRRPAPGPTLGNTLILPTILFGKRPIYYFYVSRVRLPLDAVEQLGKRADDLLEPIDLLDESRFYFDPASPDTSILRVVDPLTIAENLNWDYQQARDAHVNYAVPNQSLTQEERDRITDRQQRLLLAAIIDGLLTHDPDNNLGLKNEFGRGQQATMREFIRRCTAKDTDLLASANRAAAAVCYWLESDLMRFVEQSYTLTAAVTVEDFPVYLESFANSVFRLNECPPGQTFLTKISDPASGHFLHTYVLPQGPPGEDVFQVGRKAAAPILYIWSELVPAYVKKHGADSIHLLVQSIKYISREEIFTVVQTRRSVRFIHELRTVEKTITFLQIEVVPAARSGKWLGWANRTLKADKVLGGVSNAIELWNLNLSVKKVMEAQTKTEKGFAILGTVGSLADTVSSFQLLLRLSTKTAARIGMISGIIDAISASYDMKRMINRSDYSAAIGYGIVGVGSLLTAFGMYTVAAGAATASTGVGAVPGVVIALVGMVVTAVGWIVAVFSADSSLELFVAHCEWGDSYGEDDEELDWTVGTFKSWKGNVRRQLASLYQLVGAFTVKSVTEKGIDITVGTLLLPGSRFHIFFKLEYAGNFTYKTWVAIDCDKKKLVHLDGEPVGPYDVTPNKDKVGRLIFNVAIFLPKLEKYQHYGEVLSCDCEVHLEMGGDPEYRIPHSGKVVRHKVFGAEGINKDESFSTRQ